MATQRQRNEDIPQLSAAIGTRKFRRRHGIFIRHDWVWPLLDASIILARDRKTGESLIVLGSEPFEQRENGEDISEHLVLEIGLDMRTRDIPDLIGVVCDLRGECDLKLTEAELESLDE